MKKTAFAILLLITPLMLPAQNSYYIRGGKKVVGVRIKDNGDIRNARICLVFSGGKEYEFTPQDISEYGFDNRVYVSEEIKVNNSEKKVFLERLADGDASLYYYRARGIKLLFIRQANGELIEIPRAENRHKKKTHRELLREIANDCEHTQNVSKLVSYNKNSMTQFVDYYNECEPGFFSFTRFGILSGASMKRHIASKSNPNEFASGINYNYTPVFSFGVFLDHPLYPGNFSYNTSLNINRTEVLYHGKLQNDYTALYIKSTSLHLPLLLRYTLNKAKTRPFVNTGPMLWYNIQNEANFYKASFLINDVSVVKLNDHNYITSQGIGFTIGGGVEYNLNYRRALSLELRYTKKFALGRDDLIFLNSSAFQLVTAINL